MAPAWRKTGSGGSWRRGYLSGASYGEEEGARRMRAEEAARTQCKGESARGGV